MLAQRIVDWFGHLVARNEGIDVADYLAQLGREFGVTLTRDEVERLYTVGDLTALIARKLTEAGRPSPGHTIWPVVRRITADEMGIAEAELHEDIRFVEDLCC